ncbi:MAG: hypothetical protein KDH94_08690, partial [Coxiellaceae bacterium]|nr:hypothetical protein [Coxiellaceae bacterium]
MVVLLAMGAILISVVLFVRQQSHLIAEEKEAITRAYTLAKMRVLHAHSLLLLLLIILFLPMGGLAALSHMINTSSYYANNVILLLVIYLCFAVVTLITNAWQLFWVEKVYGMSTNTPRTFFRNMSLGFFIFGLYFMA